MPANERSFITDIRYHKIAEMELKKRLTIGLIFTKQARSTCNCSFLMQGKCRLRSA